MSFGPPPSVYTHSTIAADSSARKRRRYWLVWASSLVLVAALGTGAWLLWGPDGDVTPKRRTAPAQGPLDIRETVEKQPASTVGAMAFRFSVDDLSPGESYQLPGMWATDKILAKGINKTLVGFALGTDAAPGDEKWKLPLDGPICGYTRHVTGDNRTAVLYAGQDEEHALCDHVVFFDLDDGKQVWSHEFPVHGIGAGAEKPTTDALQDTPSVTLTHDTVAVTWGGGTLAYDMDHGKQRWSTKATGTCHDDGAAGGGALLVRQRCWSGDKNLPVDSWDLLTYKIRKVDPQTGRTRWTYSAAKGIRAVDVPSTDPTVLAVSAGDTGITELLSLDDHGKNRATIRLRNGTYVGECALQDDYTVLDYCPTVAVGAGQVFLRSKDDLAKHTTNWVIGFDLATGNTTQKFESGPDSLLIPVEVSGDRLLALRESQDRISPNALVALDPRTGEEKPFFSFGLPPEAENFTSIDFTDVLVEDGRLYFGAKSVTGPAKGQPRWVYAVLGIGSSTLKNS
ncbi:PQQ-binding-like beta-propeller repeat protein [Streptomyces griseoruber]|uniref:outer membrane protein assembly factor BamB family protein n=1 Tax=Streptomyces griseoruber TaxID=1943 RepID=UPI00379028E8